MKKDNVIGIVIAAINVILIVVCVLLFIQKDRTAPTFQFEEVETVYRTGMDTDKLLEGIRAYDETDGDVTDRIVLEKKTENHAQKSVIAFYAVSDMQGNVAKCSRTFPAVFAKEKEKEDDAEARLLLDAGISAELEGEDVADTEEAIPTDSPEATEEPSPTPSETPTPTPEVLTGEEGLEGEEEVPGEEGLEEEIPGEEPVEEPPVAPPVPQAPAGAPSLTLQTSQVTVPVGVAPAWVSVIGSLSDDVDTYETLFANLQVSNYDRNTPGTYQVTVHTVDSDGNTSQPRALTIVVE